MNQSIKKKKKNLTKYNPQKKKKKLFALVRWLEIHNEDLVPGMLLAYMRVDLRGLLAPEVTVGTLVAWLEAALVLEVPIAIAFEREAPMALGTVVFLLAPLGPAGEGTLPGRADADCCAGVAATAVVALDEGHQGAHQGICKQRMIFGCFLR